MPFFAPYLKDKDLERLIAYQYSSGQYTYLDLFLNDYWWNPVVKLVPKCVAANTLTLLGFISSAIALAITLWYSPTLEDEMPVAAHFASAFFIFMYQTLDAMDGKHARNTGTSSPLGTLLDHGCDVMTTSFFAVVHIGCFRQGVTQLTLAGNICATHVLQYIAIWYEFYFKVFMHSSSKFVGVTEVQYTLIVCQLLRGFRFNLDAKIAGMSLGNIMSYTLILNNVAIVTYYSVTGLKSIYEKAKKERNIKIFPKAAAQLSFFWSFIFIEYLFATTTVVFGYANPALVLLCCCLCSSTMCIRFILASCSEKNFRAIQWPVIPLLFISTLLVFFNSLPRWAQVWLFDLRQFSMDHTNTAVVITTLLEGFYFLDFTIESMRGMAEILNVYVFSTKERAKETDKQK